MDANARGQNEKQVSADEERLTEEIIADWRQKKRDGDRESPQIRGEGAEGGGERTLISINYSEEEQRGAKNTRADALTDLTRLKIGSILKSQQKFQVHFRSIGHQSGPCY